MEGDDFDEFDFDDEISPEDVVYTLSNMGIYVGEPIGVRSPCGYGVSNVTTEDWCDFFNSLIESGW